MLQDRKGIESGDGRSRLSLNSPQPAAKRTVDDQGCWQQAIVRNVQINRAQSRFAPPATWQSGRGLGNDVHLWRQKYT